MIDPVFSEGFHRYQPGVSDPDPSHGSDYNRLPGNPGRICAFCCHSTAAARCRCGVAALVEPQLAAGDSLEVSHRKWTPWVQLVGIVSQRCPN